MDAQERDASLARSGCGVQDHEDTLTRIERLEEHNRELLRRLEECRQGREEASLRGAVNEVFLTVADDDAYHAVLEVVLRSMGGSHGLFGYLDPEGNLVALWMEWDIAVGRRLVADCTIIPRGQWESISAGSLGEGQPICHNEPAEVPYAGVPITRSLHVPVVYQGAVIGIMGVANKATDYTRRDGELLASLASHVSPILHVRLALERKEAERQRVYQKMLESESRFRQLVENMSSGVAVYEAVDGGEDFVFVDFNWGGERIENLRREDVLGRRVTEAFPSVAEFGILDVFRRVWRTGKEERLPTALYRDGRIAGWRENVVYRLPSGHVVAIYSDETARRQAEEALRESEELHRVTLESMSEAIFLTRNDGSFTFICPNAILTFGYSQAELAEMGNIQKLLGEGFVDLGELVARGEIANIECSVLDKEGQPHAVLVTAKRVNIQGGTILYTCRDVTELHNVRLEQERLIARLESQNAELERFVYTASHDLRTPVVSTKWLVGAVEQDLARGDAERVADDLRRINASCDRMVELLDDLLELSRIGRVTNLVEDVALGDLVREVIATLAGQIGARGVRVKVAEDLPVVRGDRVRLTEVLQNLVENAIKYMGSRPDPRIEIGGRRAASEVVFHVRDNGMGIEPQYHEKVFGLFEQLDRQSEGVGVGLALVKRIVELHGGRVWCESEGPGRGSTFLVALPAASGRLA
jgi:two-component system, LuxR family, sensor kinase FixL